MMVDISKGVKFVVESSSQFIRLYDKLLAEGCVWVNAVSEQNIKEYAKGWIYPIYVTRKDNLCDGWNLKVIGLLDKYEVVKTEEYINATEDSFGTELELHAKYKEVAESMTDKEFYGFCKGMGIMANYEQNDYWNSLYYEMRGHCNLT